jgi:hypothetical protein
MLYVIPAPEKDVPRYVTPPETMTSRDFASRKRMCYVIVPAESACFT